ncbi:MAG: hypothetical protein C0469_00190 [Cyanobacteria bacterium DS2.3.42]|nr:hypothetical protein [Cyanobacteria bacterium DS2.3.42]
MTQTQKPGDARHEDRELLEATLRKGGASAAEIAETLKVDKALDSSSHGKKPGAIHAAMLSRNLPFNLFCRRDAEMPSHVKEIAKRCIDKARAHLAGGTLLADSGKFNPLLEEELTRSLFYALTIPEEHSGVGAGMTDIARIMIDIGRLVSPIIPGTLSIKTLIGPVGALKNFGTPAQKEKFLHYMAKVAFQGAFAGTEPGRGCAIADPTTYGVVGDDGMLRIYGEKLFISRGVYGAKIGLFLKIGGERKVVIVELPELATDTFHIEEYDMLVLKPALDNNKLVFNGLAVPVENILPGDGLEAIFHDLDDGRWAVGSSATVLMMAVLASLPEWVSIRETFKKPLKERQMIQYMMSLMAAYILGSETLTLWAAHQVDQGRSAAVEAMICKTFSTERLREVMTELGPDVQGGRTFESNNVIGKNTMNAGVSRVYEGPNKMLGMASMGLLSKAIEQSGVKDLFVGLKESGIDMLDLKRLSTRGKVALLWKKKRQLWKNRRKITPALWFAYGAWCSNRSGKVVMLNDKGLTNKFDWSTIPDKRFHRHLIFAAGQWFKWRWNLLQLIYKYGPALIDEQMIIEYEIYRPLSNIVAMLTCIDTAIRSHAIGDQAKVECANMLMEVLANELLGRRPSNFDLRKAVKALFPHIMEGRLDWLRDIPVAPIFQPWWNENVEGGQETAKKEGGFREYLL